MQCLDVLRKKFAVFLHDKDFICHFISTNNFLIRVIGILFRSIVIFFLLNKQ